MRISKRLKSIGDLVSNDSFILDVGCDHALLDIYVSLNKNCRAIASDINEKPLRIATSNVNKYNLSNKIKIVCADGLSSYDKEVDTIVLSGLGSTTIVDILKRDKKVLSNISKLIVSSNNDYYYLRSEICKLGFKINREVIVFEKGKYYPIIEFVLGKSSYNYYELKYGPELLKEKDDVFINYIALNKNKLIKIYDSLGFKYIIKKIIIKKEIKYIDKYLN